MHTGGPCGAKRTRCACKHTLKPRRDTHTQTDMWVRVYYPEGGFGKGWQDRPASADETPYEVDTSSGAIRSRGRVLSASTTGNGYRRILLALQGPRHLYVHSLVCWVAHGLQEKRLSITPTATKATTTRRTCRGHRIKNKRRIAAYLSSSKKAKKCTISAVALETSIPVPSYSSRATTESSAKVSSAKSRRGRVTTRV